jgi:hypothetical protein
MCARARGSRPGSRCCENHNRFAGIPPQTKKKIFAVDFAELLTYIKVESVGFEISKGEG